MSTSHLAIIVAVVGIAAWGGSVMGRWWDLLTAWLIWGSVVLAALIHELRRSQPEHRDAGRRQARSAERHFAK